MLDSYNRDDMDIEIIQTSLDIVMTKYKQSNVQTSPNIVIANNKHSNVHYVPTILQPKLQNMETNTVFTLIMDPSITTVTINSFILKLLVTYQALPHSQ
jgi:hypothetical protein